MAALKRAFTYILALTIVLSVLTAGCCGVLTIIDWFMVQNKAKEINFNNIMMML